MLMTICFFIYLKKRYLLDHRERKCWSSYFRALIRIFCSILTAIVEICSVGAGLVKIAGVETEFFLTIDDSGVLRATVSNK